MSDCGVDLHRKEVTVMHLMRSASRILVAILAMASSLIAVEKPNVVLIFADDLGYGDLGCYGATKLDTPNIDRLAKQGRRFTDAHSASAVCSPSRYGLLTGKYPLRKNFWGPVPLRQGLTVDLDDLTLASLFKDAGYDTACIGKWHLGFGEETPDWNGELKPGPLELGFDSYFGIPTVNSGPPYVYVENRHVLGRDLTDPLVYGKKSVTKRYPEKGGYNAIGGGEAAHRLYDDEMVGTILQKKAIEWLKVRKADTPFFLYLATTNIHHPFTPAKRFVGTSRCGLYGDFVHELDWMVGRVLDTLDAMGVADNTLGHLHQRQWRHAARHRAESMGGGTPSEWRPAWFQIWRMGGRSPRSDDCEMAGQDPGRYDFRPSDQPH